ncbi:MAG: methyltransferase domain-containing protein [Armatimonadetes bacterium]|jgi:2-polyprenyl-3-methyl-5-hydroxy-6-metoxy-1,4-benzoquinol methylase|nr:methyltransferase domain-containing protein [Armatimonadota bacterium]
MAAVARAIDPVSTFNHAEQLLEKQRDNEAFGLYFELRDSSRMAPLSYYRMGEILNRTGQIEESIDCHRKAFELDPHLARGLTTNDHPCHDYRYHFVEQTHTTQCPMCGEQGRKHSCYNAITKPDFTPGFDPIRVWMHCDACHHIFAANYPTDLIGALRQHNHGSHLSPRHEVFPALGRVLSNIRTLAPGNRLLEIGAGAGEMAAVAAEFLFDVVGIDIRPAYANAVAERLKIPVHACDFLDYQADDTFDVICMGDVLEHTTEPVRMLLKSISLLNPGGVLWISTPNFESAFSRVQHDASPLWRACEHLNYFCYRSLQAMLQTMGVAVVDYAISRHCLGTMEITCIRE